MIVVYYPKSELLSIYYCDTIDTSDTLWRIIPVHRLLTLTIKISVVKETPSCPSISIFKIFYNPTAYMWNYLLSIKSMNKIYLNIYIEINYAQHSLDIRATTVAFINKILIVKRYKKFILDFFIYVMSKSVFSNALQGCGNTGGSLASSLLLQPKSKYKSQC